MLYRLAHSRDVSVIELLHEMDGWEWSGWLQFAELEPFGPLREDLRAAKIASTTANVWGGKTKPEHFFASLKDHSRPRGRESSAGFIRLCPALTEITA